jgi:pSer/pThr/pTyr-binding forkhead associated (FHA) protein
VWLDDARDALVRPGDYLAFEDDERVRVVPLQEGWTRIGRSLSAHIRFDDPTVSRRHALVYCDADGTRVLDDRSLNGVFRNGDRVELAELEDGDEIDVGRFRVFYVSLVAKRTALAG